MSTGSAREGGLLRHGGSCVYPEVLSPRRTGCVGEGKAHINAVGSSHLLPTSHPHRHPPSSHPELVGEQQSRSSLSLGYEIVSPPPTLSSFKLPPMKHPSSDTTSDFSHTPNTESGSGGVVSSVGDCRCGLAELGGVGGAYETVLSQGALCFMVEMVEKFWERIQVLADERIDRHLRMKRGTYPLQFGSRTFVNEGNWQIGELPELLKDRRVDVGDCDPSCAGRLYAAIYQSQATAVQVDFDDGFSPHWCNVICGHYHVYLACRGLLHTHMVPAKRSPTGSINPDPLNLSSSLVKEATDHRGGQDRGMEERGGCGEAYVMFRPRAWNMLEHNMLIKGSPVFGALFDFALFMYHNAQLLYSHGRGPFLYLSKIESASEAALWDDIFEWTERKLLLPVGCIKGCVLIESLPAVFEMHEILYALRRHSAGLNCGLWDYTASFITRLGHRGSTIFPDRNIYVSMERHFLKSYRELLVATCHKHGAPATGGMFAGLIDSDMSHEAKTRVIEDVYKSKLAEAQAGADGGLVYDLALVPAAMRAFTDVLPDKKVLNQIDNKRTHKQGQLITSADIMMIPTEGATLPGVLINLGVSLLFIVSWMRGAGHFLWRGQVEDSATAEISRSQLWQQIKHSVLFENINTMKNQHHVTAKIQDETTRTSQAPSCQRIYTADGDVGLYRANSSGPASSGWGADAAGREIPLDRVTGGLVRQVEGVDAHRGGRHYMYIIYAT
eukprot:GHVQ01018588.1.p1 GENE.GHVQ01018588.1~~GHVQ01018588.1.p1  ORF type:complete len:726 (+),score=109.84 GHVQ01018588.1:328-2505(+)